MTIRHILALASCCGVIASPAFAQGVFDFADPCKKAENEFANGSNALRESADATIAKWEATTEPTDELKSYYIEAFRLAAYNTWSADPTVAGLLKQLAKADKSFDPQVFFMETVYPQAVTKDDENKAVLEMFRIDKEAVIIPRLEGQRAELETQISEQKATLDASCKPDVVSQIFRATFGNAAIIIDRNSQAAKNENGDIAGFIRLTSGISLTDIGKQGILGGDNSELRKLANSVAGGENSELRKALRSLDETFNPARWKVDLPDIKVGSSGGNPPKIETKIGGTRVCVPWC